MKYSKPYKEFLRKYLPRTYKEETERNLTSIEKGKKAAKQVLKKIKLW